MASRFGKSRCPYCSEMITKNAVGRKAHMVSQRCRLNAMSDRGEVCLLPRGTRYIPQAQPR